MGGAIAILNDFAIEGIIQENSIHDNADNRQRQIAEEDAKSQGQDCYRYGKRPDEYEATDEQYNTCYSLTRHQPANPVEAK